MAGDGSEEDWRLDLEGISEVEGGTLQTVENLSKRRECVLTVCRCCYSAAILLRTAVRRGMVERVQASALQIGSGQACLLNLFAISHAFSPGSAKKTDNYPRKYVWIQSGMCKISIVEN